MGRPRRFLRPERPRTPGAKRAVLTMPAVGILPFDTTDDRPRARRRPGVLGSLTGMTAAVDAALDLFDPARRPAEPDVGDGYVDLLGDEDPTGSLPGQRLMISTVVPRIYERWWRPLGARVFTGAIGGMRDEHRSAAQMLRLRGDARALA